MKCDVYNTIYFKVMFQSFLTLLLISTVNARNGPSKPNIVFITAEDLGWDDVGFHGSPQIPTPSIDALALSGVILNNYYVSPSSFASKAEFMTGKYATKLGLQHGVLHNKQPAGLPWEEKILPQYLKDQDYSTHAIGKWGLGFFTEKMLPWNRGFDTFYGGLTGSSIDYYTHAAFDDNYGLDLRRNNQAIHNETGHYSTELYTEEAVDVINKHDKNKPLFLYVAHQAVHSGNVDDPLQAPHSYLERVKYIKNHKRRLYAAMVLALDESVLNITAALSHNGMMENTIIIFTTDSGGAAGGMELNAASNFPLRGSKLTVWEGAIRGVCFVYSDLIMEKARVNEEMFHSTDWLPTILNLAGNDWKRIRNLDGYDIWDAITTGGLISPRFEILHQYDPLQKNLCALRVGDYKMIINQDIGFYGDWYPRPAEIGELLNLTKPITLPKAQVKCDMNYPHPFLEMHAPPCDSMKKPCLFNIQWDPCEFHNLADFMPNTLKVLLDRLHYYSTKIRRPRYPSLDKNADPEHHDGIWGPWININDTNNNSTMTLATTPLPYFFSISTTMEPIFNAVQNQQGFLVDTSTNSAPPLLTLKETPRWEQELYNKPSDKSTTTVSPLTTTVVPNEQDLEPTYKNFNGTDKSPFEKESLNVVTDNGDIVGIGVKNLNETHTKTQEYSHINDDFIHAGEGKTTTDAKGKTTLITVASNQSGENPVNTQAILDDIHLNKNNTLHTSSISDDTLSYSQSNEYTTKNQQTMIYASGPAKVPEKVEKTPDVMSSAVSKNNVSDNISYDNSTGQEYLLPTNDSGVNETTGEERPQANAANVQQQLPPAPPVSFTQSQLQPMPNPVVPSKPAQQNAAFNPPSPSNILNNKLPPAILHPPTAAALRPDQNQVQSQKEPVMENKALSMKTGSESITSSESEASSNALTEAKTDSKLPALQNPHILATLNNLADAGDKDKNPGKQGLSSEVAIAAGQEIGPGKMPAQNFIKEPKYAQVEKPVFEKPTNPFADMGGAGEKAASSTSSSAGSETESETVVGAGAKTGSDTNIGGKPKQLLSSSNGPTPEEELKESAVAKEISGQPGTLIDAKSETDSFVKTKKPSLGSSLKTLSSHSPLEKGAEFSLNQEDHNIVNPAAAEIHRPFQSVSDVIDDKTHCPEGRSCIEHPQDNPSESAKESTRLTSQPSYPNPSNNTLGFASIQQFESNKKFQATVSSFDSNPIGTEATSKELGITKLPNQNTTGTSFEELPANDKLHKFFGQIKVDNKKLFYISGSASEDKDLVYPSTDSSGTVTQNDVRKHNIGFNVMVPTNVMKQAGSPKFKERSKVESSNAKTKKVHPSETHLVHSKNKTAVKKVFDMIADRTRKTKVEIPPVIEEHEVTGKTNIASVTTEDPQNGNTGDIGATKPLKGTLIESKGPEVAKSVINNDTTMGTDSSKSHSNTGAGDLGSIVTLVGKVKVDRLSSKRMKHNNTDEHNAHKKTVKEHMSVKHMQPNNTETNAANVDQITGPSNSIIVSSVIVVLIASFVVVGIAVVAIVAVVARHCRLGKQLSAS